MSIYRNNIIIPLFNKFFKSKSILPLRNSTNFYKTDISHKQFRLIYTTSTQNKIVSFNLSDIGEGIREVIVKEWYVKEGDKVSQFENICEVQSDKASVTITSRYDGTIKKLYHSVDDIALVGKPLVDIDTIEDEVENIIHSKNETHQPVLEYREFKIEKNIPVSNRGLAIPSVRRIAKEHKINVEDVTGTGKDGRVLKEDILNYINIKTQLNSKNQNTTVEPIRGYTRIMIRTMTEAMKIPHFVLHDEIRVTDLVKLREKLKEKTSGDLKITYLPFFIKATSNAISQYPVLNSRLDDNHENIIYNLMHNIAIAMDTPSGLAVPVIKNVQEKSIVEISKEINRLQELGKRSKFTKEDLSDGTFSFSNIGAIGGTYAKPIILPPQSAILVLGAFQEHPRFGSNGTVSRELICGISGAGDHRIIDGATMARFLNVIKEQIETPEYLLLNL